MEYIINQVWDPGPILEKNLASFRGYFMRSMFTLNKNTSKYLKKNRY